MIATSPPPALVDAVARLWRLPPPGPENLFTAQAFIHLRQTCEQLYSTAGPKGAVEAALFALLLAPWEEWVQYADIDWRAFRVPWIYTTDGDVFAHRSTLPSPDTLSWKPFIYTDRYGDEVESERPS